jgi:hypothetical protein
MKTAEVTRMGVFDMQVCVPQDATDEQVEAFAEEQYPCGTTAGWQIRREGSELLQGAPERRPCEERAGHAHIMLDA